MRRRKELREYVRIKPSSPSTAHCFTSDLWPFSFTLWPIGGAVGLHESAVPLISDQHTGLYMTPYNAVLLCDTKAIISVGWQHHDKCFDVYFLCCKCVFLYKQTEKLKFTSFKNILVFKFGKSFHHKDLKFSPNNALKLFCMNCAIQCSLNIIVHTVRHTFLKMQSNATAQPLILPLKHSVLIDTVKEVFMQLYFFIHYSGRRFL